MSQVYLGSSSTPSVPTSFVTDVDGPVTPAANVLNILGGYTPDDNTNGIQTTGVGSTLTVQLTNRFYDDVTTLGNVPQVPQDLFSFDLGTSAAVYRFKFEVVARDLASGDGIGYTLLATFKTDGAAATRIDSPYTEEDESSSITAASVDMVASVNNAVLQVTGVFGSNISFATVGEYITI